MKNNRFENNYYENNRYENYSDNNAYRRAAVKKKQSRAPLALAIISLVAELEEEFDITIPTVEIIPENFNSAEAMWNMITRLQEEG